MKNRLDWTRFAESFQAGGPPPDLVRHAALAQQSAGKYRNRITLVDGYRFHSKLEADRYRELKLLKAAGEVLWFTRQVPFWLAPNTLYRADFLVCYNTHQIGVRIEIEETKGCLTEAARVKLALLRQLYGLEVRVLTRSDVQRFPA